MKYKIVDKKAPRFRKTQFETRLVIDSLYEEFVKATGIQINIKDFRAMYNENMEVIKKFIETERNGVTLPEQMGNIRLSFFKMRRPFYNYMEGWITGEGSRQFLFDSDGMQGKIVWDYRDVKYKPRDYQLFGFVGCRDMKKRANKAFITTPEIFKKVVYRKGEQLKKRIQKRNERINQRSNQSVEDSQQGSQLGQPVDQQVSILTDK